MKRKKKPNRLLISGLISALAALAIVAVAPGFAGPSDKSSTSQKKDNDGDHDNDPNTALEDDHTTADSGDNAHPSGKDRSVENGKSGNQGKAESNPDDSKGPMRYEGGKGDDKPQGPGGTDRDDQDGNNGCGNDDDFDDDNNGWCGKPSRTKKSPPSGDDDDEVRGNNETCPDKADMTQGKSCSEPDDDGRGPDRNESGRDKDEDGNNGCGNDDDRTDDNEGWCGKPDVEADVDEVAPVRYCPDGSVMPAGGNCGEDVPCPDGTTMDAAGNCIENEVLGETIDRAENPAGAATEEGPSVLGIRLSPTLNKPVKVAGAVLPFTGGDVLLFLVLALALFCSGLVIMKKTQIGNSQG